jgi:hypothetical protein
LFLFQHAKFRGTEEADRARALGLDVAEETALGGQSVSVNGSVNQRQAEVKAALAHLAGYGEIVPG